ncbi:hypothetical protein BMH32_04625 [Leucobacter sp. OLJS4]|uniref:hypothetical protein n=1 Tax=unclassified Leucobacter TaxID=2621730 RepID=UPI000C197EEC|nr:MULTISPECIES: hypothetical protein [unclassified Leucobacter]PIJ55281.1 hypothetical protein BMH30_01280 [Leucobacter sp. OLES1]PII81573.1 hypothetical protein BMH25_13690 [Leucobacter sp. OLCALW19]PII86245.1 hypothetical protein BMH26_14115 [Leucobacter sp. OLTLW20]PII90140.1 hypothetical protein BMH27_12280 [Leucobacter sp. OLAS13]PII97173.1 hypothetical protein BMH29_12965 [Leucobacter sp. OLDS2]
MNTTTIPVAPIHGAADLIAKVGELLDQIAAAETARMKFPEGDGERMFATVGAAYAAAIGKIEPAEPDSLALEAAAVDNITQILELARGRHAIHAAAHAANTTAEPETEPTA